MKNITQIGLKHFMLIGLMMAGFALHAQDLSQVTGMVTDESSEPLIGVNVRVKGTNMGTATDSDGAFTLDDVDAENAVLIFSYVGYKTKEVPLNSQTNLLVTISGESELLDEVIVIGYGSQSREELTTSVSKLDEKVLENVPYANAASAMQGTLSGVRVQTTTGQPGAAPRIIVRGGTSINNPNGASPLYVVDGVIRPNMDNIDANNIESMQVLKDAAANSIYGARGSNGVVVITTKSGKPGNNTISYKYNFMLSQVGNTYDMIPARDYIKFYRNSVVAQSRKFPSRMSLLSQATPGGTGNDLTANTSYAVLNLTPENEHKLNEGWESMPDPVDPSKTIIFQGTDWQDILFRTGVSHDHSLSFSGGDDKGTFNLGLGYLDNEGTAIGSFYNRFSLNFNGDLKIKDNLTAYARMMYSKSSHRGDGWGYERMQAIAPTAKYRLEDGSLARNAHGSYRNPEYYNNSQDIKNGEDNLTIAIGTDWDILPGLSFEPQISMFSTSINERFFQKASYVSSPTVLVDSRTATGGHSNLTQYQADAILSYIKSFNNIHNISVKGGFSYFKLENNSLNARGQGAASDLISTLNASATPVSVSGSETNQLILGYFTRVNYNYNQKYLVSLNARYDGASNLGENYKWGLFPGISVGWNLHRENFWNDVPEILSKFKLRGSYGVNGNISGLGLYESQGVYSVGRQYGGNPAILNSNLVNPQLQWERSKTIDLGFDLGLFNDRVNVISDIYRRVTDNLLTNLTLPPSTGFSSIRTNLGSLENTGFEIEVSTFLLPPQSEFQWNLSFNGSYVKNKIIELPNNDVENNRVGGYFLWDSSINDYSWQGGLQEGQPIGNIYGWIMEKVYATDEEALEDPVVDMIVSVTDKSKYGGDAKWKDIDDNGVIDLRDRVYMGNEYPTWTGGISNYFNYKNFTFGVRMDYTLGHTKYDWSRALILGVYGTRSGLTIDAYDSWEEQGDIATYPRIYWGDQQTQRNYARTQGQLNGGSSLFYQKGNFLALREITLSYSFPQNLIERTGLTNLSLNVTGNNLHYFTKFRGLSPEDGGRDAGTYPIPKNLICGLKINF